ncbi:MAG: MFS transporter [Arenicellales bacterium]
MSPSADPPSPLSRKRIAVICGARVFLFATFMTVAATIPLLMSDWGLTAAAAGAIITSFSICYAFSLFVFAWAADYYGARRMTIVSAVVAAATSSLFGFLAHDWWTAFLLYGLIGLAQGGVYTPLIMVLSDEVEPQRRGKTMGWLIASTSIGYATSLAASGLGIAFGGWRSAFILTGVMPVVGAVILIAAMRPLPNRIHPRPAETGLADELLRNRETRLLTAGYVAHSWELLGMWAWIPAFLAAAFAIKGAASAGAVVSSAYLSGVLHLFGATAAFTMGRLSDRTGRRPLLMVLAGAAAVLSFAIGWLVHAPPVLLIPLAFAYAFVCLGDSPVLTTALSENVRPGYLGAALAWRSLAGFGAGAIAPLAVGLVFDGARAAGGGAAVSWGLAFSTLGIGGALALVCSVALRRGFGPGREAAVSPTHDVE